MRSTDGAQGGTVGAPVSMGGPEWHLTGAGYDAVVGAVGATLRVLRWGDRDLVVPFAPDVVRPLYRGATIAPWPNRVADGRYELDGVGHQLPLNEVDRGHALHGLVQWVRWTAAEAGPDSVVLEHELVPQEGYPFSLALQASFTVSAAGLTTRLPARNTGDTPAPYGCCPHPYLSAGPGTVDDWHLTLPAARRLEVDDRLVPVAEGPVEAVDCDFRAGTAIGTRTIDHAFTGLAPGADGRTTVQVVHPDSGDGTEISWGDWAAWVQVHTADRPEPQNNRVGLAVEPMSCPPNAFNADGGPPLLRPGQTHRAEWTIRAVPRR